MLLVKKLELLTGKTISLEMKKGEGYVLQGSNGSGKTVLLRTLAGIYSAPYSSFTFHAKNITEYSAEDFRSRVLYVGSTPHLLSDMTAEEFIEAPLRLGIYKDHKTALPMKEYLKRWHLAGKQMSHLSSGQKQLLMLLRALSLKAEILLLDEPTSHMDPDRTAEAEDLIRKWKTSEKCYLVVSHSSAQAERLGKKIDFKAIAE